MTSGMRDLEQRLLLTGPPEDISDVWTLSPRALPFNASSPSDRFFVYLQRARSGEVLLKLGAH